MGALLLANWKPLGLLALILGVAGYIQWLQHDVKKRDAAIMVLEQNTRTLQGDLDRAKSAITALDNGIATYQSYVTKAINSIRSTQARLTAQNAVFQTMLDNVAVQAKAARRIIDAPTVPFFLDNVSSNTVLIGVRDGVYYFRVLRPEADPVDRRAVVPAVYSR